MVRGICAYYPSVNVMIDFQSLPGDGLSNMTLPNRRCPHPQSTILLLCSYKQFNPYYSNLLPIHFFFLLKMGAIVSQPLSVYNPGSRHLPWLCFVTQPAVEKHDILSVTFNVICRNSEVSKNASIPLAKVPNLWSSFVRHVTLLVNTNLHKLALLIMPTSPQPTHLE